MSWFINFMLMDTEGVSGVTITNKAAKNNLVHLFRHTFSLTTG